jgi:hypothetical protein
MYPLASYALVREWHGLSRLWIRDGEAGREKRRIKLLNSGFEGAGDRRRRSWTEIIPAEDQRSGRHYASDMTDAEWALIARLLRPPIGAAARSGFVRGGAGHLFTFCP